MKRPNKVLVVDDSRVINSILTENISSQLHLDVVSAFSMEEAMNAIIGHRKDFFVAILDLNLPDAPHGEIVQAMLTLGIRPIILTGNTSDDLHDEMMELPIVDYVVKRNLNEMQYVIDLVQRLYDNFDRHVLVVDDSKSSRKLIRTLLERHNFNVEEAVDGLEGLDKLNSHQGYSLIITDYNMPNLNGVGFIGKAREKYSRNDVAIIGISGVGTGSVSVRMLKAGANDFINRPFLHEEFYCRVNQNIDFIYSYKKLREQAFRDFLTNLYNRRFLFETGAGLFENARRQNISLAVAMIDIDNFKKVNDVHGHKVGDMMLQHVAVVINRLFRDADIVARVGGEEFCALCVNISEEDATNLFERLRKTVMGSPLKVGELTIEVTISVGFTVELTESFNTMMAIADGLLYQAKRQGRNQVAFQPL